MTKLMVLLMFCAFNVSAEESTALEGVNGEVQGCAVACSCDFNIPKRCSNTTGKVVLGIGIARGQQIPTMVCERIATPSCH